MWSPQLLILSAGLLAYFRSLFFGFTYLDDNALILGNLPFISNLGNLFEAFRHDVFFGYSQPAFYYRPLMTISLMLDAQFGGAAPFMYHFSNLAWHLGASCLVYLFLKKIAIRENLALFFALVFTVHPVLAQAVAWIPGRNDSMLAVFVLAAAIALLNKNIRWHLVFFAAALLTKETAVVLPVFFYRERKLYPWWAGIISVWFIMRKSVLGNLAPIDPKSLTESLPTLVTYAGKVFFPQLSVLPVIPDMNFLPGILAVLALVAVLIVTGKWRNRNVLFGLAWFFIFLVPSFIRPDWDKATYFLEHRLYLPIIGLFILLAEVLPPIPKYARGAIITVLAVLTVIHSGNFADRMVFWTNAVATSPHSPLAHRNLGAMYFLDKNFDPAETHFKQALELNPVEPMAHNNLGLIYMNREDFLNAEQELKKELEYYPNYDNAHYNLGLLYYRQGKKAEAETEWRRTLELNPNYGVQ